MFEFLLEKTLHDGDIGPVALHLIGVQITVGEHFRVIVAQMIAQNPDRFFSGRLCGGKWIACGTHTYSFILSFQPVQGDHACGVH
jgi:hypothetical protein